MLHVFIYMTSELVFFLISYSVQCLHCHPFLSCHALHTSHTDVIILSPDPLYDMKVIAYISIVGWLKSYPKWLAPPVQWWSKSFFRKFYFFLIALKDDNNYPLLNIPLNFILQVELNVTPRTEGTLKIVGVRWKLSGSVAGFREFGPDLTRKRVAKAKTKSKRSLIDNLQFLVIKVLPLFNARSSCCTCLLN